MKKFFLYALFAVALVVVVTVAAALLQSPHYRVERSTAIHAPASNVYAVISDFRRFEEWSPWEKNDPAMQKEYGGTPGAEGSTYSWKGNDKVGEGRMTIVSAVPNEKVDIKLEFFKPWTDTSRTVWSLKEEGSQTTMSWVMEGERSGVIARAIGLFIPMDKMIGKDFEDGLANLKALAERNSSAAPTDEAQQTN